MPLLGGAIARYQTARAAPALALLFSSLLFPRLLTLRTTHCLAFLAPYLLSEHAGCMDAL